jgi:hypothetical protein
MNICLVSLLNYILLFSGPKDILISKAVQYDGGYICILFQSKRNFSSLVRITR